MSSLPLARVLPSGLNATELTPSVWPVSGCADLTVAGHIPQPHRLVALPLARVLPSGLNATDVDGIGVAGERRRRPDGWLATSHSRTVLSSLPLARVLPSGLNATELTESV